MMIVTNDGLAVQGTPEEIVTELRQSQRLGVEQDNVTYMAAVASRVRLWKGERLTYQTPAEFLQGLKDAELLEIIDL